MRVSVVIPSKNIKKQNKKDRKSKTALSSEGFNDWGGRGYDYFIPGEITKQPLPGMRLHNPLHGQQACPEFIVFDQRVG